MEEFTKEAIFERLRHSLQLLASPAVTQLKLLPPYVCKADELALEFDNWQEISLHNYRKEFSVDQISAMSALDAKLDWLSNAGKEYWSDEAVRTSPEWQNIRYLGTCVLDAFGWPVETPPSHAHEYRPVDPVRNHQEN
jgi:hypothetical protein